MAATVNPVNVHDTPPGHTRVTELYTHRAACLSCCWVARWQQHSCSFHCPRLAWSEPRSAWSPWSLPGPLWKPETENHVTKQHIIQRKERIYYNIHNRSHHCLCWLRLPLHSLAVTDTMKSQTSRNPTPFYRIRSSPPPSSSCSEANKPKLEQEKTHLKPLKSTAKIKTPTHLTFWDFNDTSANIWFSTFRLIKNSQTTAKHTERTCSGQETHFTLCLYIYIYFFFSNTELAVEPEPLKSAAEQPQVRNPWWLRSALWWLWLKPIMHTPA